MICAHYTFDLGAYLIAKHYQARNMLQKPIIILMLHMSFLLYFLTSYLFVVVLLPAGSELYSTLNPFLTTICICCE